MRDRPHRSIHASAPLRICDNGGWTDTWFAGHGRVFNIAVRPGVEVRLDVWPSDARDRATVIHVNDDPDGCAVPPERDGWGRHPLLEAAIAAIPRPDGLTLKVTTGSSVPAGASTGTSAAVTVALLGALDRIRHGSLSPRALASKAHAVETESLGRQSGVQDQLCAAIGGINFIEVTEYPDASVTRLDVPASLGAALDRQLILVCLGRSHDSSRMHEQVIARLRAVGPQSEQLETLRRAAEQARDAIRVNDLLALGASMRNNTAAQSRLHPDLVSPDACRVIDIARAHDAWGWKVNGAGGEGGSITVLTSDDQPAREALIREIERADPGFANIPIHLSLEGLQTWEN